MTSEERPEVDGLTYFVLYVVTFDLFEVVVRCVTFVMNAGSHTKWSCPEDPALNLVSFDKLYSLFQFVAFLIICF